MIWMIGGDPYFRKPANDLQLLDFHGFSINEAGALELKHGQPGFMQPITVALNSYPCSSKLS
jgi:hypothetical protein